jgi:hypothetical protein
VALTKVSVLSLPSFTWYEAEYTPTDARNVHTCHVVGSRQMLVVGGLEADVLPEYNTKDPFPQGLGIFDLTEMQWKNQYDADADPYVTPQIIKEGIASTGEWPQTWDDPLIATWIKGDTSRDVPSPDPDDDQSGSRGNIGVIAGSAVGGIIGAALIICAIVLIWRRRERIFQCARQRPQAPTQIYPHLDLHEGRSNLARRRTGHDERHRRYEMRPRGPE